MVKNILELSFDKKCVDYVMSTCLSKSVTFDQAKDLHNKFYEVLKVLSGKI